MSGAVGSRPSFTRSGLPSPSLRSSSPAGRASTALRSRNWASDAGLSVTPAMLDSPPAGRSPPPSHTKFPNWPAAGARRTQRHAGDASDSDTAEAAAAADPGAVRQRRRAAKAQAQEAAPGARPPPALRPRSDLDHLRDDDGGLERAA